MTRYETSGQLTLPLVTLHTVGDELVPFWHEVLYAAKVDISGDGSFIPLPVVRYGHGNFTLNEVAVAFFLTVRH
jgi:hypothetical protein